MSQSGFTPISIYYSTTASAVPTAANLVPGELAINTNDGKLYYEDSSGVVQVLASKATSSGTFGAISATSITNSGLTTGRVVYTTTGGLETSSANLLFDGTTLTANTIKDTALTSGRVTYAGASGLLSDSSKLTFDTSNLTVGVTGLSANADGATGKLVLRKPNEASGNPQITRMLDFAPYYPGYDEAVVKASISAGIDSGTQNGQLGFMVALGGVLAQKMGIASDGIVTMSAYGAGAATFSAAGVISSVSDETWKTKDGVPTNTDAMLQKLEPGYWFYNEEKAPIFGADRQLGFYAQNVHEAIGAEAAPTPEEGKPWGYYDRSVLAVAVMSLKNALTTIEELKQRIIALESK
jgi:hypothetical protein